MASLHDMILNRVVRDASGRPVLDPVATVGQRVLIVPPDGKVMVMRATDVSVDFPMHGFPTMSISGQIEEFTSVDGVLLEATELNIAPPPDTKTKRKIEEA